MGWEALTWRRLLLRPPGSDDVGGHIPNSLALMVGRTGSVKLRGFVGSTGLISASVTLLSQPRACITAGTVLCEHRLLAHLSHSRGAQCTGMRERIRSEVGSKDSPFRGCALHLKRIGVGSSRIQRS